MSFVQPRASHRNLAGSCDGAHGSPFLGVLPVCSALRTCLGPEGWRGFSLREARGEGARRRSPALPGRPAPLRWSGAGRRRTVREHAVLGEGSVHGLTEDHDEVHAGSVAVRGAQVGVHLVSSREVPWGEVQQVAAAPTRARLVRLQSGAHLVGGSRLERCAGSLRRLATLGPMPRRLKLVEAALAPIASSPPVVARE